MFGKRWTVFRVRGIPVEVDLSLLLFLPYVAFVGSVQYRAVAALLDVDVPSLRLPALFWGAALAIALFASVLVHEIAHALVALSSGGRVRSITLMMLGGVTRIESDFPPEREASMAAAGPLTSFALAALAWAAWRFLPLGPELGVLAVVLAWMNAVLGIFNLLPAFPLDGGRVLRGLLARPLGRARATRVAAGFGRALAVVFGIAGFLSFNPILLLVAFFVWRGATAERAQLEVRDALAGVHVAEFMNGRLGVAHAGEDARDVARRLVAEDSVGARVLDGADVPVGIVTTAELTRDRFQASDAAGVPVGRVAHANLPRVRASDDAVEALDPLQRGAAEALVVVGADERIVGLVTLAELQRALLLARLAGGRSRAT